MLADIEVDRFVKRINSSNGKKSEEVSEEISDGNIQNNNTLIISEKIIKYFCLIQFLKFSHIWKNTQKNTNL